MSEFQREDRYIVIKRSDLKKVPVAYRSHLVDPMFALLAHLPQRRFAVIESDWPEFEPVWRMIEARVTGVVPEVMRWPLKGVLPGVEGISKAVLKPVVVLASDYDALAAQRDEGLERERLSGQHIKALEALNQQSAKQRDHWIEEHARLQQRLAEVTDLLKHMTCSYHRALENGYDRIIFLGGDCDSVDKMENDDPFYAKARAFLASPGGVCIKKSPAPALNLPRRKVKAEYSTAEEDAQADAWNAALDAVQELNR